MIAALHIEIIFYCATFGEISAKKWDPVAVTRNNLLGFTHALNAVRSYGKIKKFIYVSSEEVYGKALGKKSELLNSRPENVVSASESGAEAMLSAYFTSYRLPLLVARLSQIVFGGVMNENNLLKKLLEG
ncbi:unnamed protein product [Enterobius vermicularis]|uniref:NAD(P)-bd_dom domain-containing protein n=1 Tax=Enterobius vermicularis TaxID=51028 RepID=A0A0N4V8Y6_ENTVE|nr:unnamed protein product [Enterobius vermicularis]